MSARGGSSTGNQKVEIEIAVTYTLLSLSLEVAIEDVAPKLNHKHWGGRH